MFKKYAGAYFQSTSGAAKLRFIVRKGMRTQKGDPSDKEGVEFAIAAFKELLASGERNTGIQCEQWNWLMLHGILLKEFKARTLKTDQVEVVIITADGQTAQVNIFLDSVVPTPRFTYRCDGINPVSYNEVLPPVGTVFQVWADISREEYKVIRKGTPTIPSKILGFFAGFRSYVKRRYEK